MFSEQGWRRLALLDFEIAISQHRWLYGKVVQSFRDARLRVLKVQCARLCRFPSGYCTRQHSSASPDVIHNNSLTQEYPFVATIFLSVNLLQFGRKPHCLLWSPIKATPRQHGDDKHQVALGKVKLLVPDTIASKGERGGRRRGFGTPGATMSSTVASSVRLGLRDSRQPSSPHTPSRFISSTYSSPGSTFRQEEDAVVIEIGSRGLRAGFEGEAGPQCTITFRPEESRRIGDHRGWAPGRTSKEEKIDDWGKQHEIWRMDLSHFDLGLMEDKLERAVREVYNKFLLTDAGSARLVLVLPSILPHPILSSLLTTFFDRWKFPSITLLPAPAMAAVAAGLRSALVVDIGWHETVATSMFELREIHTMRTTRGMKTLTQEMGRHLASLKESERFGLDKSTEVTFDLVEEIVSRLAWYHLADANEVQRFDATLPNLEGLSLATDSPSQAAAEAGINIDWPSATSSKSVTLPLPTLSEPLEAVFFAPGTPAEQFDDHEWPLPLLVYKALLSLRPDARAVCMSRIVFVGGGAKITGLCKRVITEVEAIVKRHGWNAVRGKPVEKQREKLREIGQGRMGPPSAWHGVPEPPGKDYVEEKLQKQAAKDAQVIVQGVLRQVESLGSWTGASLLASLKIKGFVEVEREKFLSHGLAGAHRDVEISVVPQRQSYGPGALKTAGDRSSWTLAGWA
jgi:actin-related protein